LQPTCQSREEQKRGGGQEAPSAVSLAGQERSSVYKRRTRVALCLAVSVILERTGRIRGWGEEALFPSAIRQLQAAWSFLAELPTPLQLWTRSPRRASGRTPAQIIWGAFDHR